MAATVTRSTSSVGVAAASSASVARRSSVCGGVAGGGEVVELLLAAGHTEVGGVDRAEGDGGVEVGLRDAVDVGLGSRCLARLVGHPPNVSQPGATCQCIVGVAAS